ncbi:MAG TPA: hemerythrin domain-containing protein [Pseudomonadales bacterium]|nr:hemerythrin domain-containing protein [Pseudomonadales bacterium]
MQLFDWQIEFETGNALLDDQHRLLIDKVNDCNKATRREDVSSETLITLIEDVQLSVANHFREEEELLLTLGLADEFHLSQHARMVNHLTKQIDIFKLGNQNKSFVFSRILFPFYDWYLCHLLDTDSTVKGHLHSPPPSRREYLGSPMEQWLP